MSPDQVSRTGAMDGIRALRVIVMQRIRAYIQLQRMSELQNIECVVFDLDGVLIDSSRQHAQAYSELWAFIGIDGPD